MASPRPSAGSMRTPALAVIAHNSLADLERFFDRKLEVAERLGVPLVAVDNASTDGSAELLRARGEERSALRLIEIGHNAGYAAAVNAAFAAVPGSDVMLLNPDVELPGPEPVADLTAVLAAHPRVAVAAPRMIGEDGAIQPSARRFPSLLALLGTMAAPRAVSAIRRSHDRFVEPSSSRRAVVVDWVIGAAMLIRRDAFDDVGGWDERFFLYIEDTDFCRRCARAGWAVAYVPEVVLRHGYRRASSRPGASVLSSGARRHHIAGLMRLFAREPRLLVGRGRVATRGLGELDDR
jgi:N-acetylglucosaminyl-diphospho-decaprenol L-rhamnosyltransferase